MGADYETRKGDRLAEFETFLTDAAGTAVNLTGVTAVRLHVRSLIPGSTPKVNALMTVVDAAAGRVKYSPIAADVDTVNWYRADVAVTFADGRVETFPKPDYLTWLVTGSLV